MAIDADELTEPEPELPASSTPARPRGPAGRHRSWSGSLAWYVVLSALSLIVLLPIYFTLVRAHLRPRRRPFTGASPFVAARASSGTCFSQALDQGDLGPALLPQPGRHRCSSPARQVLTSVLAAYAFAFLRFPFKRVVFALFMATLLLPLEVTLLPNLHTDPRPRAGSTRYQGLTVPVPGHRLRHVPHPPGLPRHPRRDPRRHPARGLGPLGQFLWSSRCRSPGR